MSLQKFIETVFVSTLFYTLRNAGPNPGSPMNYRFFCNRIIYNGKVRIKYLTRIMLMNSQVAISMIENIKSEWTLESRVTKAALSYFGHVVRAGGMEDDVMHGIINGARRR